MIIKFITWHKIITCELFVETIVNIMGRKQTTGVGHKNAKAYKTSSRHLLHPVVYIQKIFRIS